MVTVRNPNRMSFPSVSAPLRETVPASKHMVTAQGLVSIRMRLR